MNRRSFQFLVFCFLLFVSTALFAQNATLKITHLTSDFYVYETYNDYKGEKVPSNSMYLVTNSGVVLFDTPWDSTQFQPLLDSIYARHKQKVLMSISTHHHADRTAGVEYFRQQGIKTYSSKLTFDLCKQHHEKQPEFYFTKDTTFTIGNYSFQTFFAGEGHTKDNIVVWFEKEKILYGGCLIKSTESAGLGNIADANLLAWETTIKTLLKKYPVRNFVIPGHFGWTNNKSLQHTLKLLKEKS